MQQHMAPPAMKETKKQPFSHRFIAGGVAGVSEICIFYPLDVAKTLAQLSTERKSPGMFNSITSIVRNEGFFRLYRGLLPPVLMESPKRAIKFGCNELYKPIFTNKTTGQLGQAGAIAAGMCAGMSETVVVVPFELLKIRLQAKENRGLYANTWDALNKIVRGEGISALYKGSEATMWRHGVWNGGYFGVIHLVRGELPKPETKGQEMGTNFVAGVISGTFGTMLNTPFDVVKTRIQNQDANLKPGQPRKYNWTLPAIGTVAKEEGPRALYKGFVPKVARLGPGGGVLLVVFDVVSEFLATMKDE